TSRPTSSAFNAIRTIALMRSPSVGVRPVVGSGVTSLTEKIPNCMTAPTSASIEVASSEAIMGTAEDGNAFPTRSLTVMPRVRAMSPVHGGPLSGGIHPQDPSPLRFGPGVQDGHRATEAPTPIGYR